jgi:hypothetical protein
MLAWLKRVMGKTLIISVLSLRAVGILVLICVLLLGGIIGLFLALVKPECNDEDEC